MSIDLISAEDEVYGIVNSAWLSSIADLSLPYSPVLSFPGQLQSAPNVDQIYAEVSMSVVKAQQDSISRYQGMSMYEYIALLAVQVYSPKNDASSLRIAKQIAVQIGNAFCKPSPSGEIWFTNQKVAAVAGNVTRDQVNVVVTCTFRETK